MFPRKLLSFLRSFCSTGPSPNRRKKAKHLTVERLEDRSLPSGDFGYALGLGSLGSDVGQAIAIDAAGNAHVTGEFQGTVDFDPGPGVVNLNSVGGRDIFVAKYSSAGALVWAKSFGGLTDDAGLGIALDSAGNVYIIGTFQSTVDFDPGIGTFDLTSAGAGDVFISKLDSAGNFVWAVQFSGTGDDLGNAIAVDGAGNLITAGAFIGNVEFDPGSGSFTLGSVGNYDAFVCKLSSAGEFVWAKQLGGTLADGCLGIAVGPADSVYTTGNFASTDADFDPGTGTFPLGTVGGNDIFVSKLDSDGTFVWAKQLGGTASDLGHGIAVDGTGVVSITGIFSSTNADFDPGGGIHTLSTAGSSDAFISKLDSTGSFVWAKRFGGTIADASNSIGLDSSGNVYTTGHFQNTVDFDPGPGVFNLAAAGFEIFVSKLDSGGNFAWAKQLGGLSSEAGNAIALSSGGTVFTTGFFQSANADFDPGPGAFTLGSAGGMDIFVSKLGDPVSHFAITGPTGLTAGVAGMYSVTAVDEFGVLAPNYTGTIHFTSTDAQAQLPPDATLTGGSGTFSFTLKTAGNQTVTATDTTTPSIIGATAVIAVTAGPASQFVMDPPSSVTAGSAFVVRVTALDQFNNTATGYGGTVHFASSDTQANLPAESTLTNGTGVFGAALKTAGGQSLTATDTVTSSLTTTATIAVSPAAPDHFSLSAPLSASAGIAFIMSVTARDAFDNTATSYGGTVHFSSTDGQALLPGNTEMSGGHGLFAALLQTTGSQTITATDTSNGEMAGSALIAVASPAGQTTHFNVSAPSNSTAGNAVVILVTALDASDNIAVGYNGIVNLTSSDGQAFLPVTATLTNGVGFFAAILRTAGMRTIAATDTTTASITGTSNSIAVSPAALHHFGIITPATAVTGNQFSLTVTPRDAFNNPVSTYSGTVQFSSSDADAILPPTGPLTGPLLVTFKTPGNQTITATDLATPSIAGTSSPIATRGLVVNNFTPTPTGFTIAFNKPFNPAPLNLYHTLGGLGVADVTLVNSAAPTVLIRGSVVLNPTNTGLTFVRTGAGTAGALAAGTYILTLRSSLDGFKDSLGGLLDGNNDGVNGDNFVTTFTVVSTPTVILSVPDFARGPDGATNIKVPNNSPAGNFIPITLVGASAVTDLTFNLGYNPALLNISGASNGPSGTFAVISNSGGVASFSFHSASGVSGTITLGHILAQVPNSAASSYRATELLSLSGITSLGASGTPIANNAIHAVAYFADASGDSSLSGADASLITRVSSNLDSGAPGSGLVGGFGIYPLLDPAIVGDLNTAGAGTVDGTDVTLINSFLSGTARPQIPNIPTAFFLIEQLPQPATHVAELARIPADPAGVPTCVAELARVPASTPPEADFARNPALSSPRKSAQPPNSGKTASFWLAIENQKSKIKNEKGPAETPGLDW